MKKDFSFELKTLKGEPLKDEKGAVVTAKAIAEMAWLAPNPQKYDGNKKAAFFKLALALQADSVLDMKPEEISDLKAVIGEGYSPLIVGQMYQFLDE